MSELESGELESKLVDAERRLAAVHRAREQTAELGRYIDQLLVEVTEETKTLRQKATGDATDD